MPAPAPAPPDVVVIGSLNVDYVIEVSHRPAAGETVLGGDVRLLPGGKGANQAVAVAVAGGRAAMVGCVGDDPDATLMRAALERRGVDVRHVASVAGTRTGNAYIFVTPDGENTIVVASGANRRVDAAAALAATAALGPAAALLQGELPAATTERLLAGLHGGPHVVVNLAPVMELREDCLTRWDTLIVNAGEAAQLLGLSALPDAGAQEAAAALRRRDDQAVVITLGPEGAVASGPDGALHLPAPQVEAVDTTGAGDAFAGALTLALARGQALADAIGAAVLAGARAVTHHGAQPS